VHIKPDILSIINDLKKKNAENLLEWRKSCTFAAAFDEAPVRDEGGKDF